MRTFKTLLLLVALLTTFSATAKEQGSASIDPENSYALHLEVEGHDFKIRNYRVSIKRKTIISFNGNAAQKIYQQLLRSYRTDPERVVLDRFSTTIMGQGISCLHDRRKEIHKYSCHFFLDKDGNTSEIPPQRGRSGGGVSNLNRL